MLRGLAIYASMWILASYSWAGETHEPYPSLSTEPGNRARGQLEPAHLTIVGITVWQHTLDNVLQELGPATIQSNGHNQFVCYVSSDSTDRSAIVFETNDLGGPERTVTSFVVTRASEILDFVNRCAHSSKVHQEIATASGIGLGITESGLENVLGPPTHKSGDKVYYRFVDQIPMSEAKQMQLMIIWPDVQEHPYWNASTTIEAHFSDGELISIIAHKVETY